MPPLNEFGQPVGLELPEWTPRLRPQRTVMPGRLCRVEPLDPALHARDLYGANARDTEGRDWTYLSIGPFSSFSAYKEWCEQASHSIDPLFFAIVDSTTGQAAGVASYLRIEPQVGAIEVGFIKFSPLLQGTGAATEAMYLMMRRAFDELGYRRYEWKCDDLNEASKAAARRLGFTFEGVFRQATIYKGRSRDTAWFSIIDGEWPRLRAAFERWLAPENFSADGAQKERLSALIAQMR